MKREFIVERQGRSFVLYAGLLDLAHQNGLRLIATQLVQIPAPENQQTAICTATVVLEQDGVERSFSGIGDACPGNVAHAMQTCLIRMAETRAKARALRDAVNIGVAAVEELGDEEEPANPGSSRTRLEPAARGNIRQPMRPEYTRDARPNSESTPAGSGKGRSITDAQIKAIREMSEKRHQDADELVKTTYGAGGLTTLTFEQAAQLIKSLNGQPGGLQPAGR